MFKQFKTYKQIATSYTDGEAFKATLLAHAQRILILTSGVIISLAFVQYIVTAWDNSLTMWGQLFIAIVPTGLLALIIEIGVILGAATIRANVKNILGWSTLVLATLFSIIGEEIFFNKLSDGQPIEIHVVFAIMGLFSHFANYIRTQSKQHQTIHSRWCKQCRCHRLHSYSTNRF